MDISDVLVIGAGQAGLSAAHHLDRLGLQHMVVDGEAGPGGAWRHRWPGLTMATVNGIRELPGMPVPAVDPARSANVAVPEYFDEYEQRFALKIRRPVVVKRVDNDAADPALLLATTRSGEQIAARALINATGTWTRPHWPYYPGSAEFAGTQLHTHDYRGPAGFAGKRVVVIGGGISAVQLLLDIAPVALTHTWVTREPPRWRTTAFTAEEGSRAVAQVAERVARGLPPRSVVSVTGLPLTESTREAIASGVLARREMFTRIVPEGVQMADGTVEPADILLWCTGFRPALGHLGPLHLRHPLGGIVMSGTQVAADPRIHLIGYGPSASTIGANRAGRAAASAIARLLAD